MSSIDRLQQLKMGVDPVQTELAIGYADPEFTYSNLFPLVRLSEFSGTIPLFTDKTAYSMYDVNRANGASSNVLPKNSFDWTTYELKEKEESSPLDYKDAARAIFDIKSNATMTSKKVIDRYTEKSVADLVQDANSYASSNKVTLTGTNQWSDYTNSNPVGDVDTAKEAIRQATGMYPNVMHIGASTFKILKEHTKLLSKIQYSMKGVLTVDLLQEIFNIQKIVVGKSIYWNGTAFTDIWGDNAVLACVDPAAQTPFGKPNFGYVLGLSDAPIVDTWASADKKTEYYRYTDFLDFKLTFANSGYLIKDTNA